MRIPAGSVRSAEEKKSVTAGLPQGMPDPAADQEG